MIKTRLKHYFLITLLSISTIDFCYSQDLEINLCDDNGSGYANFNIEEIENYVFQTVGLEDEYYSEEILVSTSNGNLISIKNPSNNPNSSLLCDITTGGIGDIAVNSNQEIFICAGGVLSVDNQCNLTLVSGTGASFFNSNSLSFDDLDNAYLGFGTQSYVFRFNIVNSTFQNFVIWHDFGTGSAGGDFVTIDSKMYVSWKLSSNNYRLYEVTLDNNRNYVSHIDLGQLPEKTYGLALELGELYGVTPNKLFKIDLNNLTFTNIIINSSPQDEWYGAAGLHEAIKFVVSTHLTIGDAQSNTNELNGDWTNTISGGQTLFVRIENSLTGQFDVFPIDININVFPNVNEPENLELCYLNGYNTFDLNQVSNQMQIDSSDNITFTYYMEDPEINSTASPVSTLYQSIADTEILFVSVVNDDDECNSVYSFQVINSRISDCLTNNGLIEFPDFFTPNNDGFNDFWNIKVISELTIVDMKITIFDRYGKLLYTFGPNSNMGWDGTNNGLEMPSSDYWFLFTTKSGIKITNHFTLKR
ncbi:MAG: gliding motility-associated-like protein [Nonlabens sp.]|jgi:gliding motility-associated-like protein|uniref:T9SS type B sorting domain-containing protein n=1 Tax=Nonlabens sp. TaxID=1888209 RepID=UPI0039E292A6